MKHVLDPLVRIPGVRIAALVTSDGVPIAYHEAPQRSSKDARDEDSEQVHRGDAAETMNELSGLATSWLGEITRAVGPLSWDAPTDLVLRAARGTLLVKQAPRALLLVIIDGGVRAEEMRLPMQVAVARMERHLRECGHSATDVEHPPGIFPAQPNVPQVRRETAATGESTALKIGKGAPEASGE